MSSLYDERQPILRFKEPEAVSFNVQGDDEPESVILRAEVYGEEPKKQRLASLDMFRGLTMVGMILVKNQGSSTDVLTPFAESPWEGLRLADAVFPCFLFIAGLAISLAMRPLYPAIVQNSTRWVWIRVVRRVVLLFAIGLLFNFLIMLCENSWQAVTPVRVMGVLQRIALCYGVVVLLYLLTPVWAQRLAALVFALAYLIPSYVVNVPDRSFVPETENSTLPPVYSCGVGVITPECNFGSYVDGLVFGTAGWMEVPNDPDGLFSTLSAIVTTFLGLEFGRIIRNHKGDHKHVLGLSVFLSASCLTLGLFLNFWIPFVKGCWTTSFALATAGIAGLAQSVAYYAVDVAQWKSNPALHPLVWIGSNPITIFVGMIFIEIIGLYAKNDLPLINSTTPVPGQPGYTIWQWLFEKCFHSWIANAPLASLIFAFVHLLFWMLVAWLLYVIGVFIRL